MKKLKQLCLLVLLLLFCASCSRIASANYETVEVGTLRDQDTLNSTVTIQPLNQKNCTVWFVQNACYDALSNEAFQYSKKLSLGDTVYIYQNDNTCYASTYNINDAKKINRALQDYYWKNVSNNWYWFLILIIAMAWFGWGRIESLSKSPYAFIFGTLLICIAAILAGTGKRLYPAHNGMVTQITATQVKLNNNIIYPLASPRDISTQLPIKVGQHVTAYRYAINNAKDGVIFLSTQKLSTPVLKAQRIYPEILLITVLWFWLASLLMSFAIQIIKIQLHKKENL